MTSFGEAPQQVQQLHSAPPAHSAQTQTLPSIDALISHPPRPYSPRPLSIATYQHQDPSPRSPHNVYNVPTPRSGAAPSQQSRPVYMTQQSSVSPVGPPSHSHQRYSISSHEAQKYQRTDSTSYPTPQSPRRTSFARTSTQAWPAPIPQNYTFTAQPMAPVQPSVHSYGPYVAQPHHNAAAYPPQPGYGRPPYQPELSEHEARARQVAYGENVSSQIESFDLEAALARIADFSKQMFEFSNHYCQRAHQTQRSGPLPGSTPDLNEIDKMLNNGADIHHNLSRMREVMVLQQAALAERSKEQIHKAAMQSTADEAYPQDQNKDAMTGPDTKKRRGRAAPPGRCHSCARSETPEWRRGPDGARTLCNACGLRKFMFPILLTSRLIMSSQITQSSLARWVPKFRSLYLLFADLSTSPVLSCEALEDLFKLVGMFPFSFPLSRRMAGGSSTRWERSRTAQYWRKLQHQKHQRYNGVTPVMLRSGNQSSDDFTTTGLVY